jgi:tetratricopeptide (TPR) repeat protein
MAAIASARLPSARSAGGWLFGPAPDLLIGCGLLSLLAFALFMLGGESLRIAQPGLLFPLGVLLLGMPHYGGTLLRVYEHARDRRSYAFFSVGASGLVAAWFVLALASPVAGTWLATLYLAWSPWHYTGQNYGLAVMFLRRRGVALAGPDKRFLYAAFLLSFALALVAMHAEAPGAVEAPVQYSSYALHVARLGIPLAIAKPLALGLGVAALACFARAAAGLLRSAPAARALAPAALLAATQAVWFALPAAALLLDTSFGFDAFDPRERAHYITWIALFHSAQYLWVTAYYARQSADWRGGAAYGAKVLAAGAAIWTLPSLAFGPAGLGVSSMDAGLALLIASAVNVHHFILDGAIWKLRGRIAEVLIRSARADAAGEPPSRVRRGAIWAACAASFAAACWLVAEDELTRRALSAGDLVRASASQARLAWLGRDSGAARAALASAHLERRELGRAREQLARAEALAPTLETKLLLARVAAGERDFAEAAEALEAALSAAPERADLHAEAARAWLAAGRGPRALPHLERAAALRPDDASLLAQRDQLLRLIGPGASALTPASPWLFGRWRDLLLGCGLLYTLLFAAFLAAGPAIREAQPALLFPVFLTFASMPHYGATLLRVYERARDRRAYALFSLWATLGVAIWLVAGALVPAAGAWLVTLYLTWSPWHYTGQNYGLAVMFLRRRGLAIEGVEKRWLYASYVLSFVFVFVMLHEARPGAAAAELPSGIYGLPVRPLGIPAAWSAWLQPALLLAYVGALGRSWAGLLRRASLAQLAPAACLAFTQLLWFVVPSAVRQFGVSTPFEALDWALHDHYFVWIAAGHAVQYLWVTAFTARHSPGYQGVLPFYGKALASSALP